MAWIEPKINWKSDDWLNATDYNRIKNNALEIYNLLSQEYTAEIADMGNDKTTTGLPYADEWNTIVDNLEIMGDVIGKPFYTAPIFSDNGNYLSYAELNIIEQYELLLYNRVSGAYFVRLGVGNAGNRLTNILM